MPLGGLECTVIPQLFPAHWLTDAPDIVFSDFPSRVRIGYVERANNAYSYVMREQFEKARLSLSDLHEAAVANLARITPDFLYVAETPGGCEAWLADEQDNFNAARILLPAVQDQLVAVLDEPFMIGLPCRDWFVCWSTQQAEEWQARNRAEVLRIFQTDDYNLTPDVLLFSEGKFSVFLTQSG